MESQEVIIEGDNNNIYIKDGAVKWGKGEKEKKVNNIDEGVFFFF